MSKRNPLSRRRAAVRRLTTQPLEPRRMMAASMGWDGPGLGSAELTYFVSNSPASLTQAETTAAIETALAAWAEVADITFIATNVPGLPDSLDISFEPMDGPNGKLGQAYFPDDVTIGWAQNDWIVLRAQRIACRCLLQTRQCDNVSRVSFFDFLAIVRVHHHHAPDTLPLALHCVHE